MSALPSTRARVLAFVAILLGGLTGGVIGAGFATLTCHHGCGTQGGIGGIVGALLGAGGVAVVAVLTLRAMGEWRRIQLEREASGES